MTKRLTILIIILLIAVCSGYAKQVFDKETERSFGVSGMQEDVSKRSRFTKVFIDGENHRGIIGTSPIHYLHDDGSFDNINTDIVKSSLNGFGYENITNTIKSHFPNYSGGENQIEISSPYGDIAIFKHPSYAFDSDKYSIETEPFMEENAIFYNSSDFISSKYTIIPDGIKNDIILNERPTEEFDMFTYKEQFELPNGWYIDFAENDNSLAIFNQNNEKCFVIPEPYVFEQNGDDYIGKPDPLNFDENKAKLFSFKKLDVNTWEIEIKISGEWLLAEDREYPVVIDPTILYYSDATNYTGYVERNFFFSTYSYNSTSSSDGGDIFIGVWYFDLLGVTYHSIKRGWAEFDVSGFPAGGEVTDIKLYLKCNEPSVYGILNIDLLTYEMSVQPSASTGEAIWNDITSTTMYAGPTDISSNSWYNISLNSSSYTDFEDATDWFAVGFREYTEDFLGTSTAAEFQGHSHSTERPYLMVDYTPSGTPGLWTGDVSTDWNTAGNWDDSAVPTSETDITIPSNTTTPNDPTLSSDAECMSMTINTNGILNGGTGKLEIWSDWTNNGTFNGNTSNVEFNGASVQTISGAGNDDFYDFSINKTGNRVYLNKDIGIEGKLDMMSSGSHVLETGTRKIDFTP